MFDRQFWEDFYWEWRLRPGDEAEFMLKMLGFAVTYCAKYSICAVNGDHFVQVELNTMGLVDGVVYSNGTEAYESPES